MVSAEVGLFTLSPGDLMTEELVDYRFLLANERTFLAYVRTALALQIAGLGVLQFLTLGHAAVRLTLALALVATGSYLGLTGYRRFRANEQAMRLGAGMQPARATIVVAVVVVLVPLVAVLLLSLG